MKYLVLSFVLLFSCVGFAQGVKQADLVGTWHFSKMKANGETVVDIANPKVGQDAALKKMKKQQPGASKDDEKKVVEQVKQMQDAFAKMYCTFKGDGTCEEANMNTVMDPNGKPKTGTYKLVGNGSKLTQTFEGQANDETTDVKIQNNVLVLDIKEMQMQLEYKK